MAIFLSRGVVEKGEEDEAGISELFRLRYEQLEPNPAKRKENVKDGGSFFQ